MPTPHRWRNECSPPRTRPARSPILSRRSQSTIELRRVDRRAWRPRGRCRIRRMMTDVFRSRLRGRRHRHAFLRGDAPPRSSLTSFSSVIQLQSEEGATSALDWLEADRMKPCPGTCAVQRSEFDVDDIPDARGVHASASAEDIAVGNGRRSGPFDAYWVGFTDGPLRLHGRPRWPARIRVRATSGGDRQRPPPPRWS